MSAQTKDGGQAFPVADMETHGSYGMTLRDYFAAKFAHAELMTCGIPGKACDALVQVIKKTGESPEAHLARVAYEMADAMLAAREVKA